MTICSKPAILYQVNQSDGQQQSNQTKVMSSSSKQDYLYSLLSRSRQGSWANSPTQTYVKRERTSRIHMEDSIDYYDLEKESNASTYDSSQRTKLYNTSYSDSNILRYQKIQPYANKNYEEEMQIPSKMRLSGSNNLLASYHRKNSGWNETNTPREKRNIEPYLQSYQREERQLDFTKKASRKYSDRIRIEERTQFLVQEKERERQKQGRNVGLYSSHRQSRDIPFDNPQPVAYQNLEKSRDMPMFLQRKLSNVQSPKISKSVSKKVSKTKLVSEISISDFVLGPSVGNGKFAHVFIARLKANGTIFAIKRICKEQIRKNKMEAQLALEIKLQLFMNHPNILKLYHFFDDENYIYLVMEYMEEGSLFDCMKKRNDKMNEKQTAEILIEVSNAIVYLHDQDIVHRDIKPENILVSHGMRKLCDFGWATICTDRRSTYCGTFDYAAPQILQGKQYGLKVDLWCLGILTYQLLIAKVPFHDESRKETIKKIINSDKEGAIIPDTMSIKCRNFIESLLRKKPQERLTADDLHSHPYLALYIARERLYN